MTGRSYDKPDPKLDLILDRTVDVSPELAWAAWTQPQHIKKWFTPAPWQTVDCEIDLRPGGIFRTVMRSPEGEDFPNLGCYLELVENKKLVWTTALLPGFRPAADVVISCGDMPFTAIITFEPHKGGSRYVARCLHMDEAGRKKHEDMGFYDGWSKCLDQLVDVMKIR